MEEEQSREEEGEGFVHTRADQPLPPPLLSPTSRSRMQIDVGVGTVNRITMHTTQAINYENIFATLLFFMHVGLKH
ncbi:hypothetical protein GUJ93_ZPchr0006g46089 [Zizania palustris]|uniref:Uncharacterized protein n=1 Tax=Zizania palustris TaxID=103762 RepID=A0A8J5S7R4_ZIZPA|nr:hypothetical protein GUJ93_ZPchr0006g46089 [Zizania palustris]